MPGKMKGDRRIFEVLNKGEILPRPIIRKEYSHALPLVPHSKPLREGEVPSFGLA
jgi:hypothetical protein